MKNLSKTQLSVLGQLSTKAYRHLVAVGYPSNGYDEWRHEFTADCCGGIDSWRKLSQKHYVPLCNALRAIIGLKPMADNTPQTDADGLIWTIRDRARHWELSTAYIAAIVRDRFGVDARADMSLDTMLSGLDCWQLSQLLYTVQARGRRNTAKTAERFEVDAPAEVHTSRSTVPPSRLKDWRGDVDASPRPQCGRRSASPLQTAP